LDVDYEGNKKEKVNEEERKEKSKEGGEEFENGGQGGVELGGIYKPKKNTSEILEMSYRYVCECVGECMGECVGE
jgi:hypothetical protein